MISFRIMAAAALCFLTALPSSRLAADSAPPLDFQPPPVGLAVLRGATPQTAIHPRTARLTFLGVDREQAVAPSASNFMGMAPETAARAFLSEHGSLFGLANSDSDLRLVRASDPATGLSASRFQQQHKGVPVFGGELIVHTTPENRVTTVIGQISPMAEIDIAPTIAPKKAIELAFADVSQRHAMSLVGLTASTPELWIYNPALLKPALSLNSLVWRIEVTAGELDPVRRTVLVDARRGRVLLSMDRIAHAKNRRIHDRNSVRGDPPGALVRSEGQAATGNTDADNAYDFSGDTYDYYLAMHGRDSINGAGLTLTSTVRYCPTTGSCPYPNAFWSGTQMVYGQGYANADDVVGHELTHGVTEYESGLFYYYQSGAINEALSDVWGEFIDLANGRGTDTLAQRWKMGEDLPGGAIRDMSNPGSFGDPDRMGSANYACDLAEEDAGGVHANSGVLNKATTLLVDGGSFNGKTIAAIGITATAKILYLVQTGYLSSASDYASLYNAMNSACSALVGTSGITVATCAAVKNAVDATEMNQQPAACAAPEAPICDAGKIPSTVFFDSLENIASGNWISQNLAGTNTIYYPSTSNPYGFNWVYATSGATSVWIENYQQVTDNAFAMSASRAIPADAFFRFDHAYGFEDSASGATAYDGGVLEYSTNGGANWNDAGGLFVNNGYNRTIESGGSNPLTGRSAFGSESNGYISSRLSLASLAGQNVRFRFRVGTDSSLFDYGWFIDNPWIYTCVTVTGRAFVPLTLR